MIELHTTLRAHDGPRCCSHNDRGEGPIAQNGRYRRVLWCALAINAAMFLVELVAGLAAGSVSLQADALDFLADTGSYGISLFVVGMALRFRARAAHAKGAAMGLFGLWVMGATLWHAIQGTLPNTATMGVVGAIALVANAAVLMLLWSYRAGDSDMRSVWLCSRNDVLGNVAVLFAALGVFGTGTGWPDLAVAAVMGLLALQAAWVVVQQALTEMRQEHRFAIAME